ncbi:MAG: hypothetical protein NTZ73_03755 [Candidatus Diapherotrites archaeon]|nr:hypothetical protein [Candidatus Diapherotrites archaeon]
MNFPAGKVVLKGTIPFDFETIAKSLVDGGFSGYLIQTVKASCIEESVLFFKEGKMYACFAECLSVGAGFKGKEALKYFLNGAKGKGYFQAVELARSQIDLVTAFDEELLLPANLSLKDVAKMVPAVFSDNFQAEKKEAGVFESYGLGDLKI